MNDTPISDRLKQAVDDLDLEAKIAAAAEAAELAVLRGVERAAGYAHNHRSDIDALLDRASSLIDTRTDGRYADRVGRVRGQVASGVARLAERRVVDPDPDQDADG
jgi:hypothetical protein